MHQLPPPQCTLQYPHHTCKPHVCAVCLHTYWFPAFCSSYTSPPPLPTYLATPPPPQWKLQYLCQLLVEKTPPVQVTRGPPHNHHQQCIYTTTTTTCLHHHHIEPAQSCATTCTINQILSSTGITGITVAASKVT